MLQRTRFRSAITGCLLVMVAAGGRTGPVACDVDLSGGVDAVDVQLVINAALGLEVTGQTDVDWNSQTDAVDIQLLVNAALGLNVDGDGDGLTDAAEANVGTLPDVFDTDGDGVGDGQEALDGTDPTVSDASGDVIINEFMAANDRKLQDEDGDYVDWIELHNAGKRAVSLEGWSLTDDAETPAKWVFPDVSIAEGGYLIVFASDKDRAPTDGSPLHTNFKLSASGEYLALATHDAPPRLTSVFDPVFPQQQTDFSYGLHGEDSAWRYFDTPTPGSENVGGGVYEGFVEGPDFNVPRGFYDAPFTLDVTSATPGAEVCVTLDGSAPTEAASKGCKASLAIDASSVVRARAFRAGYVPTPVATHTYLVAAAAAVKSLPCFSIVGDEGESLYEPNGIMAIVGGHYESSPVGGEVWTPDGPDDYNNVLQHGEEYERPVSLEVLVPQGLTGETVQLDCGIRVQGGDVYRERFRRDPDWTVLYHQLSFRLYFRSDYGPNTWEYPLFPGSAVNEFDRIILRCGHNDPYNPFVKDELVRRLHGDCGQGYCHGTFANVFLNGEYRGYYNPVERLDEKYFQAWYDSANDWDVITPDGPQDGDELEWYSLIYLALNCDLTDPDMYAQVVARLDLTNFIDYLIVELYAANWDWPAGNWVAARERVPEGIFRFYVWDAEATFAPFNLNANGFEHEIADPVTGEGLNGMEAPIPWLYRALKANATFRQLFDDRIHAHFSDTGALSDANITTRFNELRATMSGVLPGMDTYIVDTWIPQRRAIILGYFATEGLYSG